MNKIPVGQTIAFGYAFLVTEIWTVLRICRIPALLVVAVDYLWRRYALHYSGQGAGSGSTLLDFILPPIGYAVVLLAFSVAAVGVTRAAMGRTLDQSNFYFPLGQTEWRMLSANILYALAVFALSIFALIISMLALVLAGVDFGQAPAGQPEGLAVLFASFVSAFVFGYVLVVAVRLAFFLPAVVVGENAGLERAYRAAAGNLWRVFVVFFAVITPVFIASALCQVAIIQWSLGEEALAGEAELVFRNVQLAAAAQPLLWAACGFVNNIAIMGIVPSAAAFAYMKLKEGEGETRNVSTPPPRA